MKLEFGCGDKTPKSGFMGVDIRAFPGVAFVCNAWEISEHVQPNVVEEIFSRHFFEHLTYEQAERTLTVWNSVLCPGGLLEIIVPDMIFHIQQWLSPNRDQLRVGGNSGLTFEEHAIRGFWGHQRDGFDEIWDVHKSGYDFPLLAKILGRHGFSDIARVPDAPKNLHVTARSP